MLSCGAAIAAYITKSEPEASSDEEDVDESYCDIKSQAYSRAYMGDREIKAPKGMDCHHFNRSTCLIHFSCCEPDTFYPCHKCHNEEIKEQATQIDQSQNTTTHTDQSDDSAALDNQSANRTSSPDQSANRTSPDQSANRASMPDQPANSTSPLDQSANRGSTPDQSANSTFWPDQSANRASMPDQSANSTSPLDQSANRGSTLNQSANSSFWPDQSADSISSPDQSANSTFWPDQSMESTAPTNQSGDTTASTNQSEIAILETGQSKSSNNTSRHEHLPATGYMADTVKCMACLHEQEVSRCCSNCEETFASYFCPECKILVDNDELEPYHCEKCGVCRVHKSSYFHCDVCNMCMENRLLNNHQCIENSGHDLCGVCMEEVFSGCIIFPCSHKCHSECALSLIENGHSILCPFCRMPFLDLSATIEQKQHGTVRRFMARRAAQLGLNGWFS